MEIVSSIPTEILREIFLHAIDVPISNVQDNRFPWAIDRVCKSWRRAFINYPDLWTWITINLAESNSRGQDLNAVNQGLSLCLERSRNFPLNISIHLPTAGKAYDRNSASFIPVWQTFLSCSNRWRIVYLTMPRPELVTLDSCTGKTPILESLTIHGPRYIAHCDLAGFQIAPYLTRFTLRTPAAVFMRKWPVPWMQLTNLVLRSNQITGQDHLYILLKQLRDIEELRLILKGDNPIIDISDFVYISGTPQCLQHLRVLQACCVEFFRLITAPSLSELYLEGSASFYKGDGDLYQVVAEEILSNFIQ